MLKVFSVDRGLRDLVIAETPERAAALVDHLFSSKNSLEVCAIKPIEPDQEILLNWGDEFDSEFSPKTDSVFTTDEEGDIQSACKTAQEWIDLLGPGLLAVEDGGKHGPTGCFYRASWKESRTEQGS